MTGDGHDGKRRVLHSARQLVANLTHGRAIVLASALALSLMARDSTHGDSTPASDTPPKPRLLFVDADHPSTWPQALEPIPAGELRQLLAADKDSGREPTGVQIEQALYRATFRDGALTQGHAEITVGRGARPTLVPLERSGTDAAHPIDFSQLHWVDATAKKTASPAGDAVLCGVDRNGRRVVVAELGHSRLAGEWLLAGRPTLGGAEFTISLPPVVISQLVLNVPAGLSVECDQGVLICPRKDVKSVDGSVAGAPAVWRLELGSRSSCRLRIVSKAAAASRRVFYDEDTTLVLAADRLRLQSKLQLEVFGAPLRTLKLAVPAGLRVETITYGDDFPLAVPANSPDEARELTLELPEPILGKGRTISVEASAPTRTRQLWNLPQVEVPGAVLRDGQSQLTIRAPLKLVRFGGESGLAQSEAPTYSIDGEETFLLRQNAYDPALAIEVAEPAPALSARTFARLDLRPDQCVLAADIVCTASGGSVFSVTFELPQAWDVTQVEAVVDASRMIDETTRTVGDHKRVKIDFFRAVTDREPKRFRVKASRSLPRSGESIDVPVIDFPGFASQEVETLVVHGTSIELALSPADAFAAFDPAAILSVLADSPLRPNRSIGSETHMLANRWTGQSAKARITLRRGEALLAARVRDSVNVGAAQQISERVDATIVPASPVDRVLVYLSAEGPQFSWSLLSDPKRPLEGARLSTARHAEWNLPEVGELWEIRLPEPLRKEFRLEGTRRSGALGGARIGVAFVPGAITFEGTVELHLQQPEQFDVETRESQAHLIELPGHARDERRALREASSPEVPEHSQSVASGTGSETAKSRKRPGLRVFHYDRAADVLIVRPKPSAVAKGGTRFVSLEVTSFLSAGGIDDLHRAQFSIAPELAPQPFHFRLASECRLGSVAVNGRLVRVRRRGDDVTVPALPADARNRVHVEYRTSATSRLFREKRPIDVPRADADVLSFRWRVYLAPGLQPGTPPAGLRFEQGLPSFSWAERLFGPLGRSAAQMRLSSFKPDAWMVDLAGADPEPEGWTPTDREPAPAGWSSWDASTEDIPAEISLTIWHMSKFRTLTWIVCLGCLSVGLALAQLAPRIARRIGLFTLAAAAALAVAAPFPYALLAGACVSGTLIALLLSRPWTRIAASPPSSEKRSPRPGSTVSYELRTVSVLLALAALGTMVAFAQEAPPAPRNAQTAQSSSDARRPPAPADNELLIVVPVHAGRGLNGSAARLPADDELVYVEPAAIDALRRRAAETGRNAGVIFLSSDYTLSLDERQPAAIEATYRVAVMPGPARSLWLRLRDVTLAGANACRVNGRPVPIRQDTAGFVVMLEPGVPSRPSLASSQAVSAPSPPSPSGSRRAIAAERPVSSADAAEPVRAGEGPLSYEIQLACFPNGDAKPGQFAFRVPETMRTSVRVRRGGPSQTVTVETAEGLSRRVRPGDPSIDVGQTDRLRIQSGPVTDGVNVPLLAQAVQFWRLSPGLIEMDCRVTYDRENGGSDKFTWLVPAGATVRTTGDAYRAALRTAPHKSSPTTGSNPPQSGRSTESAKGNAESLVPLDFDCSTAPDGPVTLAATLLLPMDPRNSASGAPAFPVCLPRFDGAAADQPAIALTTNQVGISAAAGYRVTAATTDPNLAHTQKADSAFRQEAFGARKEPDLIFDCQSLPMISLQLAAVVPTHKVRLMAHEARIAPDRIQWQTTAEIRTENAPAFVHVLRVDRRLKIDSISVREDDVERLVRFSQSGDEVTLFLRDRAAATQDLVLTAHMPLELGRPLNLPSVTLVHAVVADVRLAIAHDPKIDVTMSDAPGVVRLNGELGTAGQRGDAGATDRAEYSLSAQAAMPEIWVTRRAESVKSGAGVAKNSSAKSPKLAAALPEQLAKSTSTAPRVTSGVTTLTAPLPNSPASNSPTSGMPTPNSTGQKPRVEVVANLELRRDGPAVGSTHVLLERFPEPSLRLSWPPNAVLRGVLLDGHPVQPVMGADWISLAVPSEPAPHHVAVYWESREASTLPAIGRIHEQLPAPTDGLTSSVLLSVTAPPDYRILVPAHLAPLDPTTFAHLGQAVRSSDGSATDGVEAIHPSPSEGVTDNRVIGRLGIGPADAPFSAWVLDTTWLRLPLAAAIFALVAATALRPASAKVGRWILNHPPLTLALVGLVWWLCLSPRAVGPLVLVAALGWLIIQLRRKSTHAAPQPSTLHLPSGSGVR